MPLPSSSIVSEIRTSSNCRTRSQPNARSISRNDTAAQNRRNKTAFWRIKCITASVKQGHGKLLLFTRVWHCRHYITAKWTLMQQMNTFLNRSNKHESRVKGVTETGGSRFVSEPWVELVELLFASASSELVNSSLVGLTLAPNPNRDAIRRQITLSSSDLHVRISHMWKQEHVCM